MDAPEPSTDLVRRIILALYDYRDAQRIRLDVPLQAGTAIEPAFLITGDDIWELLEGIEQALGMHLESFDGPRHFGQEVGGSRITEPLTPRIIARHLRPGSLP